MSSNRPFIYTAIKDTPYWVFYKQRHQGSSRKIPFSHEDHFSFKLRISISNDDFCNKEKREALIKYLQQNLPNETFTSFKLVNPKLFDDLYLSPKQKNKFYDGGQFTLYIRNDYDEQKVLGFILKLEEDLKKLKLKPGCRIVTDLPITEYVQIRLERIDNEYINSGHLMENRDALKKNKGDLARSFLYQYLVVELIIYKKLDELIEYGKKKKEKYPENSLEHKKGQAIIEHAEKAKNKVSLFFKKENKSESDYIEFNKEVTDLFTNVPSILKQSTGWRERAAKALNAIMILTAPLGIGLCVMGVKKSFTGSFFFRTKTHTEHSLNKIIPFGNVLLRNR